MDRLSKCDTDVSICKSFDKLPQAFSKVVTKTSVDVLGSKQQCKFILKPAVFCALDGHLVILEAGPNDGGVYSCRVANAAGDAFHEVNLIIRS